MRQHNNLKLSGSLLQFLRCVVGPGIRILLNLSFSEGTIPQAHKYAKILPLYKSDSNFDLNNYRPIALSISCGKVFEKFMHSRVYKCLETFKIIYEHQFGFRQKFATIDALSEITERLRMGKDKNIKCSFFVDFVEICLFYHEYRICLNSKLSKL